jgi:hypothetical protein
LRHSGSVDFFWNFRVVDSFVVDDLVVDGYVEDIDSDFGFLYYKMVTFEGAGKLMVELQETNSDTYKEFLQTFAHEHIAPS